jgi:hypothetical protein
LFWQLLSFYYGRPYLYFGKRKKTLAYFGKTKKKFFFSRLVPVFLVEVSDASDDEVLKLFVIINNNDETK